jgi:hypothetical protein
MTPTTDKDDLIAAGIAAGKTYTEAGRAAGVSEATVTRRMTDPGFRERVTLLRRRMVDRGVGIISDAFADAMAQLTLICHDGEIEGNRLRAAVALAELGRKYRQDEEMEARVRALEERLGIAGSPAPGGGEGGP